MDKGWRNIGMMFGFSFHVIDRGIKNDISARCNLACVSLLLVDNHPLWGEKLTFHPRNVPRKAPMYYISPCTYLSSYSGTHIYQV